jgi:NDP-sugar pyrophosphorylase family protein
MRAMILAAGRGTRLGELGRTIPKVLVDIGGEPLLARQISYLQNNGVERIVVNAHHLAEQIEQFASDHPAADRITVVREPELLGTAGGVRNALKWLGLEPFVVLYGDVIVTEPIAAVMATHDDSGAHATLALYRSANVEGKGTVKLTATNDGSKQRIVAFHEKTTARADAEAYINAGLYVIDPNLIAELPAGVELDFGHDVFPDALARELPLAAHVLQAPAIDMGTPAMLDVARAELG